MFKILVVEDDREMNHAVCSYLNQNGYETVGCLNANEAYDAMYGGGETVEEAKARLKAEQVRQEAVYKETAEKRRAKSVAKIGTAADIAKKSV